MKKDILISNQANAFILSLEEVARAKVLATIEQLGEVGFLRAPMAEKVAGHDNLFEIRIRSGLQIRVFYAYALHDVVLLLSGFVKKSAKTPPAEIRKALAIRKELLQ